MKELTVLYVEDDAMMRMAFASLLARQVKTLFTACDGWEGLRTFIACRPDLVVTDICMPDMDGLQMAARIREIRRSVPIVFLTGSPERLAEFKGFDPRIDKLLSKPIDFSLISSLLEGYASALLARPFQAVMGGDSESHH